MKILVPLNRTPRSESVIPFATNLALRWRAELLFVTVVDPVGGAGDPMVPLVTDRFYRENLVAAEEYIQQAAAAVCELPVRAFCRVGAPEHGIANLAAEEHCDLILLGSHGHSGLLRWFHGSVAEALVRHAPCPVLLVRRHMPIQFRRLLVPVDGSESSRRISDLIPARFLADCPEIVLLHCGEPPLQRDLVKANVRLESSALPAPEGIRQWLEKNDCDLVCMATHGRAGLEHLWNGSVTEAVARAADCPVLVLPPALVWPKAPLP